MCFGECTPLPANPRMENLLEGAFLSRVAEDYCPKRLPIQVPRSGGLQSAGATWRSPFLVFARKNFSPELADQLFVHLRKIDNFTRSHIGIEKNCRGQQLAQTI